MRPEHGLLAGLVSAAALGSAVAWAADRNLESRAAHWTLEPDEAEVAAGGAVRLRLREACNPDPKMLLTRLCDDAPLNLRRLVVAWTVNGVPVGSPETGRIRTTADRFGTGGDVTSGIDVNDVLYLAPARAPSRNPVDVTAVIQEFDGARDQIQLNARIHVIDSPGWRGALHLRFHGVDDPNGLLERRSATDREEAARAEGGLAPRDRVRLAPEKDAFDLAREPADLAALDLRVTLTVTGVLSEALADDGSGVVILATRPSGFLSYHRRLSTGCSGETAWMSGEVASVYPGTPVAVTIRLQADGAAVVQYLPNVAFDLKGAARQWSCDGRESEHPLEITFDGILAQGDFVGSPGHGPAFLGDVRTELRPRIEGRDIGGEAQVDWSLSRRSD